ncbi:unnamed protein product [Nippostrongylus brasiliensis]|uniref:CWF19-like protein 1 homolog (inferred by orthology to a C. elegans protein) n=1 Tax=Nippostrongylus brasiliensis TaxID=27835 RepID=A0A0N4YQN7_NIPBR|nr:unnamed protein product [Nippostrongylus brasiliensis]
MAKDQTRVLCVGDVNGQFEQLAKKIALINKKSGPFDLLFCVGEFFGPNAEHNESIISGKIDFDVPTYVLGPCCSSTSTFYPEESVEFSSSVTYLGKRGILNTASGLQIAYLSGVESSTSNRFRFSEEDVEELLVPVRTQSGFLGVDVLLTSMWPAEVWKHAHNTPSVEIAGSRNHRVLLEPAQHTTRFIGLAPIDNDKKQKWLYAFNIQKKMLINFIYSQCVKCPEMN